MSTIYKFQDSETVITSTSASALTAADTVPVYATGPGRTRQVSLGSIATMQTITSATSATTATAIVNYGYTSLGSSSGPITAWTLAAPVAGVEKTIFNTSTSTANTVAAGLTTAVTFNSTGSTQLVFQGAAATASMIPIVTLVGLSATRWQITNVSTAGVILSSW